jgi:predicted branched-subunit amino acid permease
VRSVASTVLTLVLFATYLGIGALAHDTHFSLGWVLASTALVWAGPAQIILISTLGSGATVVQAAIAVTVSAIRLFPMVVSVLPMVRTPRTKPRHLVLVTHFIAVTLWVDVFGCCHRCRASAGSLSRMVSVQVLFPSASLPMRLATPSQPISRNCLLPRSCS